MANKGLSMRKVREVLRLHHVAGLSGRAIARSLKLSPVTVKRYIGRAEEAGLSWPLPESLDDAQLERRLLPGAVSMPGETRFAVPDWSRVHRELRRKGVTLALLWHEYKEAHPQGMQYSWFCKLYRAWTAKLDVVMRQEHRAGEKLFVDYAGHTVPVVDRDTGELREAQIFVAVLGASSYTFAEATWTQTLPDWIASHVRAFEFFGGCSELLIPDNLRSAVSRAHRYEPDINPTYHDLACHYAVAVLPARARRPRDKAKAEVGVQVVSRWILAALRNRTFFSLGELNAAIAKLLERLNNRPFRKLPGSRRSLFEQLDRPALRPLPAERYVFAQWKKARVNIDYHVEVERHYYSVPHALVGAPARRAPHRHHRGVPVPRPARRQPRALPAAGPSHHRRRAHAREAPQDGTVVPGSLHPLGPDHRTEHRDPHRNGASLPTPPPAGVPLVPGDPAPGRQLRRGAPGGRGGAGRGAGRQQLPQRGVDPRPPLRPAPQRANRARHRHRALQYPGRELLQQLKGGPTC